MARLLTTGFELQSLSIEADSTATLGTGVNAINTTTVYGGSASYEASATTGTPFAYITFKYSPADKVYYKFDLWVLTLPTTNTSGKVGIPIFSSQRAASGTFCTVTLSTTGTLSLYDGGGNVLGTSSPLALNTRYRIEVLVDISVSPRRFQLKVNGYLVINGTQSAATGFPQDQFMLGICVNADGTGNGDLIFDNVIVNDSTGSSQNGYPGDEKIVHLYPSAAGDNNAFTSQTGGTAGSANNYTRIDEVTPDDATTYNGDTVLNNTDDFNIDNTSSDITTSSTINIVGVGVRYAGASTTSEAAFVLRCKKTASGTVSESSAITPNATSYKINANAAPNTLPIISYTDPDGAAWTKSTLDTAQIGYRISTSNTNEARISTVWMVVGYTNDVPPITSGKFPNEFRNLHVGTGMSRSEGAT